MKLDGLTIFKPRKELDIYYLINLSGEGTIINNGDNINTVLVEEVDLISQSKRTMRMNTEFFNLLQIIPNGSQDFAKLVISKL